MRTLSLMIVTAAVLALSVEAQDLVEVAGGQSIISPADLFVPNPLDPKGSSPSNIERSGTYYNPKMIRIGDKVHMYVQGGQFSAESTPSAFDWCEGDQVLLFTADYTEAGLTQPFTPVKSISPCDTGDPGHWTTGSVFYDNENGVYRMISTKANLPGANVFQDLFMWTSQDGVNGTWSPFLKITHPDVHIETTLLQPDNTRIAPADGFSHSYFRGFFRRVFDKTTEIRVDISDAHVNEALPGGIPQLIEFKDKNGNWTAARGGHLDFEPKVKRYWFVPTGFSHFGGQLQLWGSTGTNYSTGCDECFTTNGAGDPVGKKFNYFQVQADWSLDGTYEIASDIRCMPSDMSVGRNYPWLFDFEGRRFLYSATNNLSDTTGDGICDYPSNRFFGTRIVFSELTLEGAPPNPPGVVPNFEGKIGGIDVSGLTIQTNSPTVEFTWSEPTSSIGILRYNIVLKEVDQPDWLYDISVNHPAESYSLPTSGLQDGATYSIHIRAINTDLQEGAFVDGGHFTVDTPSGGPPGVVPNFEGKIGGIDVSGLTIQTNSPTVEFTWSEPTSSIGILRYNIVLKEVDQPLWLYDISVNHPAESYSLPTSGLQDGATYSIHIRAFNTDLQPGAFVDGGHFTVDTPSGGPPGVVPNFEGRIGGIDVSGLTIHTSSPTVEFTWSEPTSSIGILRYNIVLKEVGQPLWLYDIRVNHPAESYSLPTSGLQDGATYSIHIRAFNTDLQPGAFVDGGHFTVALTP